MAKFSSRFEMVEILNEDERLGFIAFFNPKEVSVDRSVPWAQPRGNKGKEQGQFEYTHSTPKSYSFELFCDLYEERGNAETEFADALFDLTVARKLPNDEERPPIVRFIWGKGFTFRGVVESVSVKYTMFLPTGVPCRATATVKMKEARYLRRKVKKGAHGRPVSKYGHVDRGDPSGGTRQNR